MSQLLVCLLIVQESQKSATSRASLSSTSSSVSHIPRPRSDRSRSSSRGRTKPTNQKTAVTSWWAKRIGFMPNKCTPRVHSRLSTKICEWDVKDTWSRLCLVGLQNVNPQKWVFKRVKVQPRGSKCNWRGTKISHMLVHTIRLKVTREEDAAFAYYFVSGFKTKLPIFDPTVKILKLYQVIWEPPRPQVCSENLLLVKSN